MNDSLDLSVVGKRQPRLDGREKITGRAVFTDDVDLPGMVHAKVLRSPYPRARIKSIDTSKAEALPGVKLVVTSDDTAGLMQAENQPLFAQDVVTYVGEEVAAVVAVDAITAEEALDLIEVDYEFQPSVTNLKKAMRPGAPQVHGQSPDNIAKTFDKDFGDPDAAFAKADRIIEDEFKSPVQHNCLAEFHIAVADFTDPNTLQMWTPSQSAATYKQGIANVFGLTESQVRMHFLHTGGAFTGRGLPRTHHYIAAFLSRKCGRPVKLRATGDEEFIVFRCSGDTLFKFRTAVTKEGKVLALEVDVSIDAGAHIEYALILPIPAAYLNWLYKLDAIRYNGRLIYTNTVPKASHHGGLFGRMSAGLIQHLNRVAEEIGMNPADFHHLNAVDKGHTAQDGSHFASCGLKECIDKVVGKSGWRDKYGKLPPNRGIGIGIGAQASGAKAPGRADTSAAMIKVAADGIVTVFTGIPDMGQGSHTVMGMIAAEVLGVTADDIRIVGGDSQTTPYDRGAFSQRGTFSTGNAVQSAAEDARQQLATKAAELLETNADSLVFANRQVYPSGAPDRAISLVDVIDEISNQKEGRFVMGRGFYNSPKPMGSLAYSFGAQIAEVEVDPETGEVRVIKVTAAHDIGRAINPLAVEGQLDGQVFSGLSQILYEECLVDDGAILNPSRLEYKLPRTYELPEIEYDIVETIDPFGPFGAKEVGEGPIVVTMAAVASAVADALGGMMPEMPITPWRVLRAIKQRSKDTAA